LTEAFSQGVLGMKIKRAVKTLEASVRPRSADYLLLASVEELFPQLAKLVSTVAAGCVK
jgi:hypothetical protein